MAFSWSPSINSRSICSVLPNRLFSISARHITLTSQAPGRSMLFFQREGPDDPVIEGLQPIPVLHIGLAIKHESSSVSEDIDASRLPASPNPCEHVITDDVVWQGYSSPSPKSQTLGLCP